MADRETYLSGEVKNFIKSLNKSLQSREVYDTQSYYENDFQALTERYFKASPWPTADSVASVVENDQNFLILYKELYFRHVYAKLTPTVDDRLDSFENYVKLFNILIGLNTEEPELELPAVWLWDIIDEFVCQFRSFHNFRSSVPSNKHELVPDELQALKDNENHWAAQSVIRYLYTLSKKAGVYQKEQKPKTSLLFKVLGEFSQIGLARVNVLLGDYNSALEALDMIKLSLNEPSTFRRVMGAYASLSYNMGVSYMMLKRYSDATDSFASFLGAYGRSKDKLAKPHQEELLNNMYGVLAMSLSLSPESVEDSLQKKLKDKYGEKLKKMQQGESNVFEEIFYESGPQFVSPRAPDYDSAISTSQDASRHQFKMFAKELSQRTRIPSIESYLRLCTAVTVQKLADFNKTDPEALAADLLMIRHKTRQLKRTGDANSTSGVWTTQGASTPFYIDKEVLHVAESKQVDQNGKTFISSIMHYEDLIEDIRR